MFHNDNFVITGNCRVIWDGVTRPESLDDGGKKYSLKVAQLASNPENGELATILDRELKSCEFRGVLPPGGIAGMGETRPGEFGDMIPGHKVFNSVTYSNPPDVYDVNGQKLDPMQYSAMLYAGATVQLILSARSYNNKSKGLGFWLNGIKIIDTTSPKLPVGGGSIDAGAVFGSAAAPVGSAPIAGQPMAGAVPSAPQNTVAPAASSAAPVAGSVPANPQAPQAPAAHVTPAPDFLMVNGVQYTSDALRAANWTEEQITAAR